MKNAFVPLIAMVFSLSCASLKSHGPQKILLVTGGCCHNYEFQTEAIKNCIPSSMPVEWTVVNKGGAGTQAMINLYDNARVFGTTFGHSDECSKTRFLIKC